MGAEHVSVRSGQRARRDARFHTGGDREMKAGKFMQQRAWSRRAAAELLDMSGKLPGFEDIGAKQLDAAVALHRMLLTQGSAYLADEVGTGKTYVALATVALFRHLQPHFRVLYL